MFLYVNLPNARRPISCVCSHTTQDIDQQKIQLNQMVCVYMFFFSLYEPKTKLIALETRTQVSYVYTPTTPFVMSGEFSFLTVSYSDLMQLFIVFPTVCT